MAKYDRRILVPYLEDVCCAEMLHRNLEERKDELRETVRACQKELQFKLHPPQMPEKTDFRPDGLKMTMKICAGIAWTAFYLVLYVDFPIILLLVGAIIGVVWIVHSVISGIRRANDEYEAAMLEYWRRKDKYSEDVVKRNKAERWLERGQKELSIVLEELPKAKRLKESLYSVNIIPSRYRTVRAAYYLYDHFSTCQESDLGKVIQTMLLDEIVQRLDRVIEQQSEILLNQRRQLALQQQTLDTANENHHQQMLALARQEQNQELQTEYLAMIEGNTRANAYFAAATWLQNASR